MHIEMILVVTNSGTIHWWLELVKSWFVFKSPYIRHQVQPSVIIRNPNNSHEIVYRPKWINTQKQQKCDISTQDSIKTNK